jgi:hypothetical protein
MRAETLLTPAAELAQRNTVRFPNESAARLAQP